MQEKFKGIFPALLTPFDSSGKVNEKELEKLVRYNVEKGVTGFYVGGTTAEAFLMSVDERKTVMDVVRSAAPESTLIAHVGSLNEREAADLARYACKLGYDAASSVTPFYYKFTAEEIKQYYYRLADAAQLPMLMYYFPLYSGVSMAKADLAAYLADPRFVGMKYTAGDLFLLEQCKTAFPDKVFYCGYDEIFLSALTAGADGGMGSTYNFMAEKFVRVRNLFLQGKIEEARQIQREINRIIAVLFRVGVMQGEKEVLNQLGFDFGVCRPPFAPLSDEAKALLRREITEKL